MFQEGWKRVKREREEETGLQEKREREGKKRSA